MREARAYNQSIYLMVGMPYLSLGTFAFLVYRAYRKKVRQEQAAALGLAGKEQPCPPPSPDATS